MTASQRRRTKCLVVDDEADFAEFVADALDALGCDPAICSVPTEIGLHSLNQQEIILLDLFMPEMTGIEVVRFLHENGSKASLIFMSGKDASVLHSARELATEWGMTVLGSLQKPFTVDDLDSVIARYRPAGDMKGPASAPTIDADDISEAIEGEQFSLVYQPQIRCHDNSTHGVETLIRWEHPVHGFVSPALFIPIAERLDLIDKINLFVANRSLETLGRWHARGLDLCLSINISPASIADFDFPERLLEIALRNQVDPSRITVEVTETAVMRDVGSYIDILTRTRMRGFGLAIDDFGTGYSSLHQMVRLPFSELKIDQAFVTRLCEDRECETVTRMATMLAHELGMKVVAEGVEDADTMARLADIGCDLVQGYFCARPMAAPALEDWLKQGRYPLSR
jgi:EAL domain-containing protein (putative c-di-GMP-specific phosphodiesterase class I)/ActR/RegA family two-component response regulator